MFSNAKLTLFGEAVLASEAIESDVVSLSMTRSELSWIIKQSQKAEPTKLPEGTPEQVIEWVREVESYYKVNCLSQLAGDASIEAIREAFEYDRQAMIGIANELKLAAEWDAWSSYENECGK